MITPWCPGMVTFQLHFPERGWKQLDRNIILAAQGGAFQLHFPERGWKLLIAHAITKERAFTFQLHFPERGWKQEADAYLLQRRCDFPTSLPRKGMETTSYQPSSQMRTGWKLSNFTSPKGDGNTDSTDDSRERGVYLSNFTSPKGDGNLPKVVLTKSK